MVRVSHPLSHPVALRMMYWVLLYVAIFVAISIIICSGFTVRSASSRNLLNEDIIISTICLLLYLTVMLPPFIEPIWAQVSLHMVTGSEPITPLPIIHRMHVILPISRSRYASWPSHLGAICLIQLGFPAGLPSWDPCIVTRSLSRVTLLVSFSAGVRLGLPYGELVVRSFCLDMIFRLILCAIHLSNWWPVGVAMPTRSRKAYE